MTEEVTQVDRKEPPDRWHPDYDSYVEWLNAEAPIIAAKRRNKSGRHRVPKQAKP